MPEHNPEHAIEHSNAVNEFIEHMGRVSEGDGLPRIAGRLFAFLIANEGDYSLKSLSDELQVSRGSISTNAKLLESLGVIERVTQAGDRQDYFKLRDDPYSQLFRGIVIRMDNALTGIHKATANMDKKSVSVKRIQQLESFYQAFLNHTQELLDSWESND
tara:strand:+ start:2609 stop:3088 length:480 start_codon:yes stop_codon:yes gene_type:complete